MKKNLKDKKSLNIAMLGHKRIPSREGGIEIVVEELSTRMVTLGHKVTCYNRSGHHVSGKDFDGGKRKAYKGVRLKSVLTLDKKGLAAMTASVSGAICAAFGKYDVVHFHASSALTVYDFYIKNKVSCPKQRIDHFKQVINENMAYIKDATYLSASKRIQFKLFCLNPLLYNIVFKMYRQVKRILYFFPSRYNL